MSEDKLTKDDREKMNLLIKHGELEFNWKDIEPVMRELVAQANAIPIKQRPPKNTRFPDIGANRPDGTPTTLEDLMESMGYIMPKTKDLTIKEKIDELLKLISLSLSLKKPAWIPWIIWERARLRAVMDKFLKTYVVIDIKENETQNNNKKA